MCYPSPGADSSPHVQNENAGTSPLSVDPVLLILAVSSVSSGASDIHFQARSKTWLGKMQNTSTPGIGQMPIWMVESATEESVL